MKTILLFEDDSPYEQKKLTRCLKATDAYLALWSMRQELIDLHKECNEDDLEQNSHTLFKAAYTAFFELLNKYDINLDSEIE